MTSYNDERGEKTINFVYSRTCFFSSFRFIRVGRMA